MTPIKISYALSEVGRRASLLAGGDGRRDQSVSVEATSELLALASVAADGTASVYLAGQHDAPIADPATEVLRQSAEEAAQRASAEAARRTKAAHDLDRARQNIARYLADEDDIRCDAYSDGEVLLDGQWLHSAGVPADEIMVVRETCQRRNVEDARRRSAREAEDARRRSAREAEITASRLAWLQDHGAPDHVLGRSAAGVLPAGELTTLVTDALLPETIGDVHKYAPPPASEITHDGGCEGDADCKWDVYDGTGLPLTAGQWVSLQAVRAHYAGTPVVVDEREYVAKLSCGCDNPCWRVARATLALPDLDLTICRQYALPA